MRKQTKLWKTKDGHKIRICDMSDSHLLNAIRMLEKMTDTKESQLISDGYNALCCVSGEMAIMHIESDLDDLERNGLDVVECFPIYENLVEDAIRRGLKT